MKDPFPPARQAGILAMAATHNYFTLAESAQKLLPSLCFLTMDPEKTVRDQAFRAIKCFLGKLEKVSENPEMAADAEKDVNTGGLPSSAAAGWTNWAVSGMTTLTSKIYKGKHEGQSQGQTTTIRPPAAAKAASEAGRQIPATKEPPSSSSSGRQVTPSTLPSDVGNTPTAPESISGDSHASNEDAGEGGGGEWEESWDDEDNWGEMEASMNDGGSASEKDRHGSGGAGGATSAGDGWDDADDWGDLDSPTASPSKMSSSNVSKHSAQPSRVGTKSLVAPPPTSFDASEFEPIQDRSVAPASAYNWDQTSPVSSATVDPNSDEFFSSLLVNDRKKSAKSASILKPSGGSKQPTAVDHPSPTSSTSHVATTKLDPTVGHMATKVEPVAVIRSQASTKPTPATLSSKKKTTSTSKSGGSEGWDDSGWDTQW
jgi:SCY1-like protein 1